MIRALLLSSAVAVFCAGGALAGDLPTDKAPPAYVPPPRRRRNGRASISASTPAMAAERPGQSLQRRSARQFGRPIVERLPRRRNGGAQLSVSGDELCRRRRGGLRRFDGAHQNAGGYDVGGAAPSRTIPSSIGSRRRGRASAMPSAISCLTLQAAPPSAMSINIASSPAAIPSAISRSARPRPAGPRARASNTRSPTICR